MSQLPVTKLPTLVSPGLKYTTVRERVVFTANAANISLATALPANSLMVAARMVVPATVVAVTATKIGFGRVTASADPDKYLLTTDLTAGEVVKIQNQWGSPLAAAETLGIFACDNAGAAAGDLGPAGAYVDVEFTYLEVVPLAE